MSVRDTERMSIERVAIILEEDVYSNSLVLRAEV